MSSPQRSIQRVGRDHVLRLSKNTAAALGEWLWALGTQLGVCIPRVISTAPGPLTLDLEATNRIAWGMILPAGRLAYLCFPKRLR